MTEYWSDYLQDENRLNFTDFIEKDGLFHRFIHILLQSHQNEIRLYLLKCMKDVYQDDCLIFTEEELNEFEKSTFILGVHPDFEEPQNHPPDDDITHEDYLHHLTIWEKYLQLFSQKKIIILPRMIRHSGMFKMLCSRSKFTYMSTNDDSVKTLPLISKIIVLTYDNIQVLPGINRRMIQNTILSEKEILKKYSKKKDFQLELMEKAWHPERFEKWCL